MKFLNFFKLKTLMIFVIPITSKIEINLSFYKLLQTQSVVKTFFLVITIGDHQFSVLNEMKCTPYGLTSLNNVKPILIKSKYNVKDLFCT